MMKQELVYHVPNLDVLLVQVQPNVPSARTHIYYFQEIVMKSVQLELMLMTKTVKLVMMNVMNVMEENQ